MPGSDQQQEAPEDLVPSNCLHSSADFHALSLSLSFSVLHPSPSLFPIPPLHPPTPIPLDCSLVSFVDRSALEVEAEGGDIK